MNAFAWNEASGVISRHEAPKGNIASAIRRQYRAVKPWLDIAYGSLLLCLLFPVFLVIAAVVKLTSRGPIFYAQWRVGRRGRLFLIYKFRTMRVGAEKETGAVWSSGPNDPRLTPVGGWLRTHHLDELPQILNVVRGDMSLVGPRPERPEFVNQFQRVWPDYERRLRVKPGLTGLAQVLRGPDRTLRDVRRKLALDLLYARKMCWWLDMLILTRTALLVMGE